MKLIHRLSALVAVLPSLAFAVYAPIPEQDQGKAFTVRLGASVYHDSNIFGSAKNEKDSMVYSVAPSITYNGSVDDQTFMSASYDAVLDHFSDRPSKKNLSSHTFGARYAHSFDKASNLDVSDTYQISKNPQSLLNGVAQNADQSLKSNQFNARYTTAVNEKTGLVLKYRNSTLAYDSALLASQLDRVDNLAGLEVSFSVLPETKLVGEYRYQSIAYDNAGALRDKRSNFFLAGVDHNPTAELTLSARAGIEDRNRTGAPDSNGGYLELSSRYALGQGSFVSGGYVYTIEEASDPSNYTDTNVSRFFVNVQQQLSPLVTASGSLTWEPSKLQGRPGVHADIDETITRLGLALSWTPTKNWVISATLDTDRISSDDVNREQNRDRFGVSARFTF